MRIKVLLLALAVLFMACGPKPAYKTAKGKKKQRYYNNLQFGGDPQSVPSPKPPKKKN